MSNRIQIKTADPAAYRAMMAMENYVESTGLSTKHKGLVRIRASQINGCTYCIDEHTRDARHNGETEQRIYALTSWRETPFFDEQERAVYLAQLIMAIITINAWNRIGVSTKMEPELVAGA